MKLPAALEKLSNQFNRRNMRERALICAAALAAALMVWNMSLMDPLSAKERALSSEMASLQASIDASMRTMQTAAADPTTVAAAMEKKLQTQLDGLNARLAAESGGLIAPPRMVDVIHDVLRRQPGITLVSLHNLPVSALTQPAAGAEMTGPFVHPVELVIEGRYLDILSYLQALEALPWRFYWKTLELETTTYPLNRVRIELSTLSLEKDWIGV